MLVKHVTSCRWVLYKAGGPKPEVRHDLVGGIVKTNIYLDEFYFNLVDNCRLLTFLLKFLYCSYMHYSMHKAGGPKPVAQVTIKSVVLLWQIFYQEE